MIYILDGMSASGKSTYAESLGLPIKKITLNTLEEVIAELSEKDDVVYDRFLNIYYLSKDEAIRINDYLLSNKNCSCKLFICDLDAGWNRVVELGKPIPRWKYESTYNACNSIKSYLTAYEVVNIDSKSLAETWKTSRNNI